MKIFVPLALCLLFASEQAAALRCGNKLVDIGDRMHKVHQLCGAPDFVDYYDQPIPFINGIPQGFNHIDVWTYNFGPNRFMQELLFVNSNLRSINQLDYGY